MPALTAAFSGTRKGLTRPQEEALSALLARLTPALLVHGSAIGADCQAHAIALAQAIPVEVYPSDVPAQQATACYTHARKVHPARPPLGRNADMVALCQVLIACPAKREEQRRGGTWSTWRLAWRQRKRVYTIYPDGVVEE